MFERWFTYIDWGSRIILPIISAICTVSAFNLIQKWKKIEIYPFVELQLSKFNGYKTVILLSLLSNLVLWFLLDWILKMLILLFYEPRELIPNVLVILGEFYLPYVITSTVITFILYLILKRFWVNLIS